MSDGPIIALRQASKRFGTSVAVDKVTFDVERGSLVALLGPSGCGKTTTLRLIAGLDAPDSGEVWLNNRKVAGAGTWVAPETRRVGMVFQDGALFPHLTITQNVAFALNGHSSRQRVNELLHLVGLTGTGERYPHQLSGGQQQRIALARALAANPTMILLDEPFSRLDAALRVSLRDEVHAIVKQAGATTVFVTHDQEEALSIADRIILMFDGRVEQIGAPLEVYTRPATRRIATFVGEANFLPGIAFGSCVECALGKFLLATPLEGAVDVMIRPEAIDIEPISTRNTAVVERIRYFGHDQIAHLRLQSSSFFEGKDGQRLTVRSLPRPDLEIGEQVSLSVRGVVTAYARA